MPDATPPVTPDLPAGGGARPDPTGGPPRPPARPEPRSHHGQTFQDPYAWLRDAEDPDTIPHLEAENAWTAANLADQAPLRDRVFEEIRRRTQESDLSVPVRDGAWWYHQRTEEGRSYPIHCRVADDGTGTAPLAGPDVEQVILDQNDLAEEGEYLGLGVLDVSPDGHWLAYAVDRAGDERHALRFRDLRTGDEAPETVPEVSYGFSWAADSATCWYTLQDDTSRPNRVIRHVVGTDPAADVEIFREDDERFHLGVGPSRSGLVAVIGASSAVTSESWLLDATDPTADPQLVAAREHGVEYSVAHHPTGLLVVSNHDGAEDFALWRAPLDGTETAPRSRWEALLPHRPGTRIAGVEAFAAHAIVHGRTEGLTALWLLDPSTGATRRFETDEAVGTIGPGANATFDTTVYRFSYSSMATPPSVIDEDLATGIRTVRKQLPVLDGFVAADYETAREWATATDGTQVPISLVWRADAVGDGPAPLVLYGYGAYEASMDPWFSIARLSLLDRGVIFAIAHVRGGGELGRSWYEHGKFAEKPNTFTDFVACARHLVATGRTTPERLAARGGSAGGLLMGAVANQAPELFRAVVAEVPFVDPLTTMLDPSLPLTVIEWDEWGDPLHEAEAYGWLQGYSPYENVADRATAGPYPAILATAGLTDPRVGFHEPAKWVARLRDQGHGTTGDDDRPVLLKVELGAGHGGPTGRYDAWRDEAHTLAFLLTNLGLPD